MHLKKAMPGADNKFENPFHELFMFNILLGRNNMAKIFCFGGKVIQQKTNKNQKLNNFCLEHFILSIVNS